MSRPWVLVLAASLAFNLAFGAAVGARLLGSGGEPAAATGCAGALPHADHPRLAALCSRMSCQLEELRREQGQETARLGELLASAAPDRPAIDRCVERIADLGLRSHRLVVDTVLEQMATLPPDARAAYCEHVRGRLCAPGSGCGMAAPEHQPAGHEDPPNDGGRE